MKGFKAKIRVATAVIIFMWIGIAGLYSLLKPVSNGCVMTYMYPTYIPISKPENVSSTNYGLYLYHEGWKRIDFNEHLKRLNGVPVLFIPGNGGSYKQVRSLGAESARAYQGGPLEENFEQTLPTLEEGVEVDSTSISLPSQYTSMLDWFTVDLEGEHSAMDSQILQDHAEYVVYSIHRILDQYKVSQEARAREGAAVSGSLPKSVILVGHSMGGFVARAAVVHPHLRKAAVETILTLSTPHQSPPVVFQPSLAHYYAHINEKWRKGYKVQMTRPGDYMSDPFLSHVVVVSISGGYNDYQVRSKLGSLDGIVPPTHGFTISSSAIKHVWLSMEHQVILWCNQLVVRVSHTLLSLIDTRTGKPIHDFRSRLAIFTKMIHSGIPQNIISSRRLQLPEKSNIFHNQEGYIHSETQVISVTGCPNNMKWMEDGLERDLFIRTSTVTILAMDGRRRWLDIQKLGSDRKPYFVFVTNLSPCSGVRLHLWPEKGTSTSNLSANKRVVEVTSKMVHIPSKPAPRQIEPGSQTEQAPPSAVIWLGPHDLHGFRFLTISVAPRPTVSGRPPPATSMGVGQFFDPREGEQVFGPRWLIQSLYSEKDISLQEDHPLMFNLTFSFSLGLLPVFLSLRTTGCGIKKTNFPDLEPGDMEISRFCRLRCFPPLALSWDASSGLHVFQNLNSEMIIVDSSPALWTSSQWSDNTAVLLLVDPHCSYKATIGISSTPAAGRFLLLYYSQISGLCFAVLLFALMRQSQEWELDRPIPSMLSVVESNLRMPRDFFFLAILPILLALFFSWIGYHSSPSAITFTSVSLLCYLFANGAIILLISLAQLLFYSAGSAHLIVKKWWIARGGSFGFRFPQWLFSIFSCFVFVKVVRFLTRNASHTMLLIAVMISTFIHPFLGLFILLLSHTLYCHNALSSHAQQKHYSESRNKKNSGSLNDIDESKQYPENGDGTSSPESTRSFGERQLELFHHRLGLLLLHLLAALMFLPSLLAWIQRNGYRYKFPHCRDSLLCIGVILHGLSDSGPEMNFSWFPILKFPHGEVKLSFLYLLAGYFSYFSALSVAPYRSLYGVAAIGVVSFTFSILRRRNRSRGEAYRVGRKHSHRH